MRDFVHINFYTVLYGLMKDSRSMKMLSTSVGFFLFYNFIQILAASQYWLYIYWKRLFHTIMLKFLNNTSLVFSVIIIDCESNF